MSWGKKDKKDADQLLDPGKINVTPEEGIFELEAEEKGAAHLAGKLKKLRAELEKCKEENREYLTGWQRCKADSINARKEAVSMAERAGNRARDTLIKDIIPALDSFDMAIRGEAWAKMNPNWRSGMENVRSQLLVALFNQGVQFFGEEGEDFDPAAHEAVQEIAGEGKPGTIAQVLRKGYKLSERVIRPAQVAIIAHSRESKG